MPRRTTFPGFLKAYCNELCGLTDKPTTSVKKLFRLVADSHPTAAETLFLYAIEAGRVDELMSYAQSRNLQRFESYHHAYALYEQGSSAQEFVEANLGSLPARYAKVYDVWRNSYERMSRERHTKELMLSVTKERLGSTRGAASAVCKELGLNKGNFYAYLKGDVSKVSLKTAREIMQAVS